MKVYQDTVKNILTEGVYKPNRTRVDTIATFAQSYKIDLSMGYPILTTKKMSGGRFQAMVKEFVWYISGDHHIRNLDAKVWDEWADENGNLETAYGRFWRGFPVPKEGKLEGEAWPDEKHRWITTEEDGSQTFDQIQYVLDTIRENPNSRRMIVTAWHPANAAISKLPPCHYTFAFNVQDRKLNCALFQRSADIALGVPFNIAAYALLTQAVAQESLLEPGTFSHTLVDAHAYCGKEERGAFYEENLSIFQTKLRSATTPADYLAIKEWIDITAPPEKEGEERLDHVPGLLLQLSRDPLSLPRLEIAPKPLDQLVYEDVTLNQYNSHGGIRFKVAE